MEEMKTLTVGETTYEIVDDLARTQLQGLSELSTETDPDGNKILKVVDAAPFAYDPAIEAIKTSVVASRKVKNINLATTTKETVAYYGKMVDGEKLDGKLSFELRPPIEKIWRISFMALNVNPGTAPEGTTGNHQFTVRYAANDTAHNVLSGTTSYDKALSYVCGCWADTVDTQSPIDKTMQYLIIKDLNITHNSPLYVAYQNRTNNDLEVRPIVRFVVTEEDAQ